MTVNLTLKEPKLAGYTPPKPFGLYDDGAAPHEILRLLLGSVNVKEVSSGRLIAINSNSFRQKSRRMCNPKSISKFIFEGDLTLDEYEHFIKNLSSKNVDYFKNLRRELTLALVAQKDRRYTESFLYIYRILEMIAVAFPLLYATTQSDFKKISRFPEIANEQ
ncbi:hypothetical protein OVA11_14830 [Caulobacter sp. SL161]|uniref:hypothetical protein n=1 Tax=Caulobacter sp. SL161 TaxID=2995156 RepID=UPI0022754996|nr:hypothetical protein [Caulobacter sp. SL161]MCY1648291.1 hypothetical protein [Caulobacter sp. SL161]